MKRSKSKVTGRESHQCGCGGQYKANSKRHNDTIRHQVWEQCTPSSCFLSVALCAQLTSCFLSTTLQVRARTKRAAW